MTMPRLAPLALISRAGTGGANPFLGQGLVSSARVVRERPVYGQRAPGRGRRMYIGVGMVADGVGVDR